MSRPKMTLHRGTCYVNVYAIHREYGGPEEGGWYYKVGNPLASVKVRGLAERTRVYDQLLAEYQHGDHGLADDEEIAIRTESHPGKAFPEHTPHYE